LAKHAALAECPGKELTITTKSKTDSRPPRALLAAAIGNIVEWYDFGLYGYFAPILARLFFPSDDPLAGLIGAYSGFAVGFAVRPLGGAFFGHFGDRISRSFVLVTSVVMMGAATVAVALLPTYGRIGVAAPILLLLIRVFQGFSVGGEFTASVAYLVEAAPSHRRGFIGSFANIGSTIGILLAALVAATTVTLADTGQLNDWAWRLPFLVGGVLATCGFLLRRGLRDTSQATKPAGLPLKRAFTNGRGIMLRAMMFTSGYGVVNYLTMVFLPTYAHEFGGLTESATLQITTVAQIVALLIVPLAGWLTDTKLRRRTMLIIVFATEAILAVPCFILAGQGGLIGFAVAQIAFGVLFALIMGTEPAMMIELFPRDYRLSGYAFSFNIGIGIAGGTSPLVALWLIHATGQTLAPALYLALGGGIATMAAFLMIDRSRAPLL
jgi:MHS family proline/betaine transporter-like MFS transporter